MRQWEKYSKFSGYFLSTINREFNDDQIVQEYSNYNGEEIDGVDDNLSPYKQSKLVMCGLMSLKDKKYKLTYEDLNDFLNNIASKTKFEHNARALVYMHVLNYHAPYILQFLKENGFKHIINNKKFRNVKIGFKEFDYLSQNGKAFHLSFFWKGIFIKLQDSEKIIPKTLSELAKELQISRDFIPNQEIPIDPDHAYPDKYKNFVFNECLIIAKSISKFQASENKSTKLTNETLGGIAYDYVRDIVNSKNPNFTIRDYNYWLPYVASPMNFPSFQAFGKWLYNPKCHNAIDQNSAYGYAMDGYLPFGKWYDKPLKKWKHYCCFKKIHITYAQIKKKYDSTAFIYRPFIYDGQGNKYAYIQHNIPLDYGFVQKVIDKVYFVLDFELKQWERTYDIQYEVLEEHYFETERYLSKIIRSMYKFSDRMAKRKIVMVFGKLGQKYRKCIDFFGEESEIDKTKYTIISKKESFTTTYRLQPKYELTDKAKPVFVQAYIIAKVRSQMIEKIADIIDAGYEVTYNDTDMIAYIDKPDKPLQLENIGTELGQWKYEYYHADALCILCPKHYRVIKDNKLLKHATAGIPRELLAQVKNQDYNYDLGTNPKYNIITHYFKQTKDGRTMINKTFNFQKWKYLKSNPICPKELYQ